MTSTGKLFRTLTILLLITEDLTQLPFCCPHNLYR